MLLKLADLVDEHLDELAALDTLDMGAPISRMKGMRRRAVGMLRYYAGMATSIHGETIDNSLPGEIFSYTLKEPIGVVGAIIPWNGPLTATLEGRPGAGDRVHDRPEARRRSAADAAPVRGAGTRGVPQREGRLDQDRLIARPAAGSSRRIGGIAAARPLGDARDPAPQ